MRRWSEGPFGAASRSAPLLKITRQLDSTKLQAQIADEQQQRNADGPPLGALVVNVDVGDREVGAPRVGRPAELASNHHALNGLREIPARAWDVDRRAREVARKSILVEEERRSGAGWRPGRSPQGNCR